MKNLIYIFIVIFISCSQTESAGSVQMFVSLDTNYTTIGTPVPYYIKINSPENKIVQFSDWQLKDPLEVRSNSFNEFLASINSSIISLIWAAFLVL